METDDIFYFQQECFEKKFEEEQKVNKNKKNYPILILIRISP